MYGSAQAKAFEPLHSSGKRSSMHMTTSEIVSARCMQLQQACVCFVGKKRPVRVVGGARSFLRAADNLGKLHVRMRAQLNSTSKVGMHGGHVPLAEAGLRYVF